MHITLISINPEQVKEIVLNVTSLVVMQLSGKV